MHEIRDILAIASLLITIITFLFNIFWQEIKVAIDIEIPNTNQIEARKRAKNKVYSILLKNMLPSCLSFIVIFYVNLPKAIEIVISSNFSLWGFDQIKTLYIILELTLFASVIISLVFTFRMLNKIYNLS